ncbi:MAG: alpha amylase C-terminal domain-containing protein, partial [Anoxybacillus ayderensis]|nr:alpha amylase C-terminal domain-containing protein [Anoxybacillus ayderensis]
TVTAPTYDGGLGFNYKWNMGWMNDVLSYMETSMHDRKYMHHKMTFSLLYAYTENFILPLSHDEVVHGKKSLLNKMPGDYWDKFAQLRLLYGYFMTHPGKKLLFMGGEFGQFDEWKDLEQLDWVLFDFDMHRKMDDYVKSLTHFYKKQRALYECDHDPNGFEWIDVNNAEQSIFSFIRRGKKEEDALIVVCNFTNIVYEDYKIGVPLLTSYREVFNSDDVMYGGAGHINKKPLVAHEEPYHGKPYHIRMTIPPYAITILRPTRKREGKESHGTKKVRRYATRRGTRE